MYIIMSGTSYVGNHKTLPKPILLWVLHDSEVFLEPFAERSYPIFWDFCLSTQLLPCVNKTEIDCTNQLKVIWLHYKNIKYLLLLFLVCIFLHISRFYILQLHIHLLSSQPLLTSLSYLAISIEMRQHICFNKTLKIWDVTYTKMHFFIQHEKNISTNHMMGIFYTIPPK